MQHAAPLSTPGWGQEIRATLGLAVPLVATNLLQMLATHSKSSPSLADDTLFASELTLSLYLIPALFAGIGINFISDRLIGHVRENAIDGEQPPR